MRAASSHAVKPFGVRRPATVVRPQRLGQQQQQPRSLSIVQSFDGNAGKALKEAAALDELIDVMLEAKSQQEVGEVLLVGVVLVLLLLLVSAWACRDIRKYSHYLQ